MNGWAETWPTVLMDWQEPIAWNWASGFVITTLKRLSVIASSLGAAEGDQLGRYVEQTPSADLSHGLLARGMRAHLPQMPQLDRP
jgi:hypothetical protein